MGTWQQDTKLALNSKETFQASWAEALPFISCYEKKRPASRDPGFAGIIKKHIGHAAKASPDESKAGEGSDPLQTLLRGWEDVPKKDRLVILVKLAKRLDPLIAAWKKKRQAMDESQRYLSGTEAIDLESLVAFARRISAHVRSPPEYDDPTGVDGLCVPGYFFPCPDRITMSRSTLFYADMIRAVPPTITFRPDPRTRAMSWVDLTTPTPKPTLFYAINATSSWVLYNPSQKPFLTGPGHYTIRCYCQAEGFLLSEVSMAETDVPGPESSNELEALNRVMPGPTEVKQAETAGTSSASGVARDIPRVDVGKGASSAAIPTVQTKAPPPSKPAAGSRFGGLFLGSAIGSEDDSDSGSSSSSD